MSARRSDLCPLLVLADAALLENGARAPLEQRTPAPSLVTTPCGDGNARRYVPAPFGAVALFENGARALSEQSFEQTFVCHGSLWNAKQSDVAALPIIDSFGSKRSAARKRGLSPLRLLPVGCFSIEQPKPVTESPALCCRCHRINALQPRLWLPLSSWLRRRGQLTRQCPAPFDWSSGPPPPRKQQLRSTNMEEQRQRAFALCLAALLGEGVYNFGELLAHPILECLQGTDRHWVVQLLSAFNSGSLAQYEALRPAWSLQPDLAACELSLRQKMCLLCLMEMAFQRPGSRLSFQEIAAQARLPLNEPHCHIVDNNRDTRAATPATTPTGASRATTLDETRLRWGNRKSRRRKRVNIPFVQRHIQRG
ncbi:hypothetical protein HPB49_003967 [Dermacentor silvarum]|uniref:Uncharacterized protein n=1 Tax=Dermacentor silvarum TaxID=543639 RepID=A0ACB8C221_DERSI|nr:hypothetical protein HPB49_003967 [Dermacentor silvarum]